jgi:hypothetical protein
MSQDMSDASDRSDASDNTFTRFAETLTYPDSRKEPGMPIPWED